MTPEESILASLKKRNEDMRAACTITNSARRMIDLYSALQEKSAKQQKDINLLSKEKHEMAADLQLLRQNEANAGVSSEHIQLLQQQLELAKSEAHAEVSKLKAQLSEGAQREAALRQENERLLKRVMDSLAQQVQAMDSEVEAHERRLSKDAAEQLSKAQAATAQAEQAAVACSGPPPPK